MLLRRLVIALLASQLSLGAAAGDYDRDLAASYNKLFAPAVGAKTGKALHLMKPDKLVGDVLAGKPIIALDVRTPNEFGIYRLTLPGSLEIPINELFLPESLDRIPRDRMVVVVCASGARAMAAATALRQIGFDNAYVLKGGLMALSKYLDPKTASPAPAQPPKQ
jgi:rhodanese-related sulfurtransferase